MGHLNAQIAEGTRTKLYRERVIEHFLRVNQCDRATFDAYSKAEWALWEDRTYRSPWVQDLGKFEALLHGGNLKDILKIDSKIDSTERPKDVPTQSTLPGM
jgi:hypothetical protein